MHYQSKQDLAMAYFPGRSKESAGKLLAREIHSNEPLMAELSKTGYSNKRKMLSPKQLQVIFEFLGGP